LRALVWTALLESVAVLSVWPSPFVPLCPLWRRFPLPFALNENAMDLEGKPVTVVGLARSGIAAAAFCAGRGARVVAADRKPEGELPPEALKLRELGVRVEGGPHRIGSFTEVALVVVSPGVPWDLPELEAARAAGVEVVAEVELGARFIRGPLAAVTGTKGKSTTTAALGAMLKEAGTDVRVGATSAKR
jgi:UDP-N-acetylmuramoylalanine--D-glutamate ligase